MLILIRMRCFLALFCIILCCADGAKILIIPSHDTGSHMGSMMPFIKSLVATKRHEIHVLDTVHEKPADDSPPHLYYIPAFVPDTVNRRHFAYILWNSYIRPFIFFFLYYSRNLAFGEMLEKHGETFEKMANEDWDLIVVDDLYNPHGSAIALRHQYERGTPYILFSTSGKIPVHMTSCLNLGRNPVVTSHMFPHPPSSDDYFKVNDFWYRVWMMEKALQDQIGFEFLINYLFRSSIEEYGAPNFSLNRLYTDSQLLISDALQRIAWPLTEATDYISSGDHCKSVNVTLPDDLKEFVEDPKSKGTIYIAMGTYAKWLYVPEVAPRVITAFHDALQRFPDHRIIFAYNGDVSVMPNIPNLRLLSWAPQPAILNHPKTKAFLSHGGLKSVKEALCSKTPFVVLPLSAEQMHNAHMAVAKGYAKVINKFSITADGIESALKEALTAESAKTAEKIHTLMLDRPVGALDLAIFHVERLLRSKSPQFHRRKGMDLSWSSYVYLEVFIALISLIFLLK